jgi:hypothetical protein
MDYEEDLLILIDENISYNNKVHSEKILASVGITRFTKNLKFKFQSLLITNEFGL